MPVHNFWRENRTVCFQLFQNTKDCTHGSIIKIQWKGATRLSWLNYRIQGCLKKVGLKHEVSPRQVDSCDMYVILSWEHVVLRKRTFKHWLVSLAVNDWPKYFTFQHYRREFYSYLVLLLQVHNETDALNNETELGYFICIPQILSPPICPIIPQGLWDGNWTD